MNEDEIYEGLIKTAINEISNEYFEIPMESKFDIEFIPRERIICYELYHQLRKLIDDKQKKGELDKEIFLHGELPKAKYRKSENNERKFGNFIPDFLIHSPAYSLNLISIEIKCVLDDSKPNEIADDFCKLHKMVSAYEPYQLGIFILFSRSYVDLVNFWKKHSIIKSIETTCERIGEFENQVKIFVKESKDSDIIHKTFGEFIKESEN